MSFLSEIFDKPDMPPPPAAPNYWLYFSGAAAITFAATYFLLHRKG